MTTTPEVILNYAIWDFNGVLVTIDGFFEYLKQTDAALHKIWTVDAVGNPALKAKYKNQVTQLFEDATNRDLYPMKAVEGSLDALTISQDKGRTNIVFSTVGEELIAKKISQYEMSGKIQRIITLAEVIQFSQANQLVKESPLTYENLSRMLRNASDCTIETYVDDSFERVMAAVESNLVLAKAGLPQYKKLFHYSPKQPTVGVVGYMRINKLQLMD